jgi:hypothetical protein
MLRVIQINLGVDIDIVVNVSIPLLLFWEQVMSIEW